MAEEKERKNRSGKGQDNKIKNTGIIQPLLMYNDNIPESQKEGTFRFALNAMLEDRNTKDRIQNEESNERCVNLQDTDYEKTYYLKVSGCCGRSNGNMMLKVYYYTDLISLNHIIFDLLPNVNDDCDLYQTDTWDIIGTNVSNASRISVYDYIANNFGDYQIKTSNCHTPYNTVKIYNCHDVGEEPKLIFESNEFEFGQELTYDEVYNSYLSSPYFANCPLGDTDGNIALVNNETYYKENDFPIIITEDTDLQLFCHCEDHCSAIDSIEMVSNYSFDGGNTLAVSEYDNICGSTSYINDTVLNYSDNIVYLSFVAMDSLGPHIFPRPSGISIQVNGENLTDRSMSGYDPSLTNYWYIDDDGYIIICVDTTRFVEYNFHFWMEKTCNEDSEISVTILKQIPLRWGRTNAFVGYITPNDIVSKMSDCQILLNGTTTTGLIGRSIDGVDNVNYYKVQNNNNIYNDIYTNDLMVDFTYNQIIVIE